MTRVGYKQSDFRDWVWFAFSALASQGRLALAPSGGTCLICLTPAGRQYPEDQGDLSVFGTLQPAPKTDNLLVKPCQAGDGAC